MISFWEREQFTNYKYIVIGSGIVGLSTAITIKEKDPKSSVLVLERGLFPTGASTKNAGFACIGSPTELLADLKQMSQSEVQTLVELRYKGLHLLRHRLGDKGIDYQTHGSYEILGQKELYCLDHLHALNQLLHPILGGNAFSLARPQQAADFGFSTQFARAMVINHFEGQLDTGKMMQSLLHLAYSKGITVLNGAEVSTFTDVETGVEILASQTTAQNPILFKARKLAICTNAFTQTLLPDTNLQPGRGQVLVTHPIPKLPFKGIFHFEEGFYYFRNFENRVIFGGGRNLDFAAETTTEIATTAQIISVLQQKLNTLILPSTPFTIDMQWAGIMAFGKNKTPLLQKISPNTVIGVKLSGMGVAIGSALGTQIAELLIE